jgi:PPOX class probable F420-dependent enzyme
VTQVPNPLTRLGATWAVRLTTYRRDGTPVGTAVNVAADGDRVYFRTYAESGKFKRLRRNARVEVAPSTPTGRATGPSIPAVAQILHGADDERAGALIDRKHRIFQGWLVRFAHRLRGYATKHFELLPANGEQEGAATSDREA